MFGFEDSHLGGNQNLTSTHELFVFEEVQLSTVHQPEHSVQFSSVAQSCPTFCDPMNPSTPGLPVHHQLPEPGWPATDGEGKRTTVDTVRDCLNIYQGCFIFTFCFHSENYELYCIIVSYTHNLIRPDPLIYLITLFSPAQLIG